MTTIDTTNTLRITFRGRTLCLRDWETEFRLHRGELARRFRAARDKAAAEEVERARIRAIRNRMYSKGK